MQKYTLGKKLEMTHFFEENGSGVGATILEIKPITIIGERTTAKDGYNSVVVGYGSKKESSINKAQKGQWKDLGSFEGTREFREAMLSGKTIGDVLKVEDIFSTGDIISLTGTTKGKGFQGVVKRHNFEGGRRSHGQKHSEREPGSIGATGPQRVFKGTRMGGRMGGDTVTVINLKVLAVDGDRGLLIVKGAVPGRRGTLLEVKVK